MSETYQKDHVLPQPVLTTFQALQGNTKERNAYAAELRATGWTLASIAAAAGISRERVRQVIDNNETATTQERYPIPSPPLKPVKEPRTFATPRPEKLARLLELQPLARQVTGSSKDYRRAGEEYSTLIADVHLNDGVPLYRLAIYLDVTAGALRSRLVRYGYITPKTGTSKSYNRINPDNRILAA